MCRSKMVAKGDVGRVDWCSCGRVHLRVGSVTVHLDGRSLRELSRTMVDAACAVAMLEDAMPAALQTSGPSRREDLN